MTPGCAEYQQLQKHYEATLELWDQHRFANVRAINASRVTPEEASALREQALQLRNTAANLVYLHAKDCPICKRVRIHTAAGTDPSQHDSE
jgi:hypothetical protein